MNNKLLNVFAFAIGAGIGSVVTWKLIKTKYEKIADEEIASVKKVFRKKEIAWTNEVNKAHECVKANTPKPVRAYEDVVETFNYATNSKEKKVDTHKNIFVISPDEFGEIGYDTVSLTYYAEEVLADDDMKIIDDVEEIIGKESLNTFGEYEDDSVFVRNEFLERDYEILLDTRKYSDVVAKLNHSVDDDEWQTIE